MQGNVFEPACCTERRFLEFIELLYNFAVGIQLKGKLGGGISSAALLERGVLGSAAAQFNITLKRHSGLKVSASACYVF